MDTKRCMSTEILLKMTLFLVAQISSKVSAMLRDITQRSSEEHWASGGLRIRLKDNWSPLWNPGRLQTKEPLRDDNWRKGGEGILPYCYRAHNKFLMYPANMRDYLRYGGCCSWDATWTFLFFKELWASITCSSWRLEM